MKNSVFVFPGCGLSGTLYRICSAHSSLPRLLLLPIPPNVIERLKAGSIKIRPNLSIETDVKRQRAYKHGPQKESSMHGTSSIADKLPKSSNLSSRNESTKIEALHPIALLTRHESSNRTAPLLCCSAVRLCGRAAARPCGSSPYRYEQSAVRQFCHDLFKKEGPCKLEAWTARVQGLSCHS